MDKNRIYLASLLIMSSSILITSYQSLQIDSPNLTSILLILGGLGLFLTSSYAALASKNILPKSDVIFWGVVIGAVLTLLGAAIQLI